MRPCKVATVHIPAATSFVAPLVPVVARALTVAVCFRAARLPLGDARQTEEHRGLIIALAGFSLAGIAIIGTQGSNKFGLSFFDITVSFLCYVGALAVQGWKARWWQDVLGDALRDAATTALLLFIVRVTNEASGTLKWHDGQVRTVAVLAGLAWLLDPGFPLIVSANVMWAMNKEAKHDQKKASEAQPSVS